MALPSPKLHKHTGQAYVYYKGKTTYLGKYGSQSADDAYWQWRAGVCGRKTDKFTLLELLNKFEKDKKRSRKDIDFMKLFREELGHFLTLDCNDIGPLALREMRKVLARTGTRNAETINSMANTLVRAFHWGISIQVVEVATYTAIDSVPALSIDEVKKQPKGRKPVPNEVVEATLPYLYLHVQHAVKIQLFTGARPNEILSIRKSLMDKVGPNGTWVYRLEKHKTAHKGKKRRLVLGPQAQAVYLAQCELHPESDWLFPSEESATGHYMPNGYMRAVRTGAKEAGQPHWTPYQLRHLRLTQITTDHGLIAAANIAGHEGTSMTQGYSHEPTAEQIRQAS